LQDAGEIQKLALTATSLLAEMVQRASRVGNSPRTVGEITLKGWLDQYRLWSEDTSTKRAGGQGGLLPHESDISKKINRQSHQRKKQSSFLSYSVASRFFIAR